MTYEEAIEWLYRVAVIERKPQSTARLKGFATYLIERLRDWGIHDARAEATVPGFGRAKQWDVAWFAGSRARLALSLKSILKNAGGTVPNRIDDLMGEVANVQLFSPEIVVGYVMVFDQQIDEPSATSAGDGRWLQTLVNSLERLSRRGPPGWGVGMIEGYCIVRVDFSLGCKVITPEVDVLKFLGHLADVVRSRNN